MANIVITASGRQAKLVFNDRSTEHKVKKAYFGGIAEVVELDRGGVLITMNHTKGMITYIGVSFDGNNGSKVDTVASVSPTSDSDLCDKIGALITV